MRIRDCNWMQVESYLKGDDRAVLPIGSTEQHAYLSLSVDAILAEKVAVEAAEPLGVPVFPTVSYGISPYYMAFPGSVTIKTETLLAFVRDILDSMRRAGFRRVLIVNGHGGNSPVQAMSQDWMGAHPEMSVRMHNWWNAPKTWKKVVEIDPIGSHASWMENFPWTRLANVALPREQKKVIDHDRMRTMGPQQVREFIGDGNYGGLYQRADDEMQMIWDVAIDETRALMRDGWR
jgi:creatinine amidohydrolase